MTGKDLVENTVFTIVARFAMIAASAALPVVAGGLGWLLIRSVNSIDEVGRKADTIHDQVLETGGNIKLIQHSQAVQAQILADHEARMRLLEKLQKAPN